MDVATIATGAITILAPYLAKAGEDITKKAADAAWRKAEDIYEVIKTRFQQEEDDYPSDTLKRFEEEPEKRKAAMQSVLEEILEDDPSFAQTLLTHLKEADQAGTGARFDVTIFGGEVGEIINIDTVEGGLTIDKRQGSGENDK